MGITARVFYCAVVATFRLDLVLLVNIVSLEPLRKAKVDQVGLVVTLEHQIGALDVAMSVALLVNVLETLHDLAHETQDARLVELMRRRLVDHGLQVLEKAVHDQEPVFFLIVNTQAR